MNVVCAPLGAKANLGGADLEVVLFAHADRPGRGAAGANIIPLVARAGLHPEPRAWDLLSLALSVIAADTGCAIRVRTAGRGRLSCMSPYPIRCSGRRSVRLWKRNLDF